jgi:hypothetical protein
MTDGTDVGEQPKHLWRSFGMITSSRHENGPSVDAGKADSLRSFPTSATMRSDPTPSSGVGHA